MFTHTHSVDAMAWIPRLLYEEENSEDSWKAIPNYRLDKFGGLNFCFGVITVCKDPFTPVLQANPPAFPRTKTGPIYTVSGTRDNPPQSYPGELTFPCVFVNSNNRLYEWPRAVSGSETTQSGGRVMSPQQAG